MGLRLQTKMRLGGMRCFIRTTRFKGLHPREENPGLKCSSSGIDPGLCHGHLVLRVIILRGDDSPA